jgi:ABC-2 type transport system permease protein
MTVPRFLDVTLHELRGRSRDFTLLMVAVAGPVIFAAITSLAFASFDHPRPVRLAITTGSPSSVRNDLVRAVRDDPRLRQVAVVDVLTSDAAVRAAIRDGRDDAGLILPSQARLEPDGSPRLGAGAELLVSQQQPLGAEVAAATLQTLDGEQWLDQLVLRTLGGIVPDPPRTLRGFAPHNPVAVTDVQASSRTLTAATYYGASMAMVFLLFVTAPVAKSLWSERRNNTLDRLLASGVSRWAIVSGKALAAQVIGMVSVGVVWGTSTVVFHADWGSPAGVAALMTLTVGAAVALSFGLACLVRTEASLDGLVAAVTFVLVLAGGNFVAPPALPAILRRISLATPNGWALRGLLDLATSGGAAGAIALPALVLVLFIAVVWLGVASRLRALVSP